MRWNLGPVGNDSSEPAWQAVSDQDTTAIEEPLEIRLHYGPAQQRVSRSLSITMRTPGDDYELAVGFLLSEGLIRRAADLLKHEPSFSTEDSPSNVVRIVLSPDVVVEIEKLQRHFYTTSSCGLCGKASLEALTHQGLNPVPTGAWRLKAGWIANLPHRMKETQKVFATTGGLHAAGLFLANGTLCELREDVGRHNAMDKVLGRCLLDDRVPLSDSVLVVSGRTSLELVQKAVVAGVPVLAAIGAPSSLAVACAQEFGVTLLGFLSKNRFNCYANPQRIEA